MRFPIIAAAAAAAVVAGAVALAGCGSASQPVARDTQTACLAGARAVIRSAPASPHDPATYQWLVRADRLRDAARKAGDTTSRQLAAELDRAGADVALNDFPPQLAIVPVVILCSDTDFWVDAAAASPAAAAGARGWIRANQPPARPGMTAGIITSYEDDWAACPPALTAWSRAARAGCDAWTITLATASGTLRVSCGTPATAGSTGVACTSATAWPHPTYWPRVGNELYVPDGGRVTRANDIAIISQPPGEQP